MRRTKIVCTIGPASWDEGVLEELVEAGMDVARINFSHGTPAEHERTIAKVRAVSRRLDKPVAILQDLAGPKVRIGEIAAGRAVLTTGEEFTLTNRPVEGDAHEVSLEYSGLPRDVHRGDTLLLSDGAIELHVEDTTESDIVCRIVVGGTLTGHKGINVPSRSLRVQFPTEKDKRDLKFGIKQGVDFVALSFVRSAEDVQKLRAFALDGANGVPPFIAKIEKSEALTNIDAILEEADGLMVARGDLGVEIPIEQVPRIQKNLIRKANAAAKPVITATQMLRSMVDSPRPTRAEATDVANAFFDGTDAVMLSEETAEGRYPVESVRMMDRLARDAESEAEKLCRNPMEPAENLPQQEAVALAAKRLAERIGAAAIATCTQSGSTTRLVSKFRPGIPLLALTPDPRTLCHLALVWGAIPLLIAPADQTEEIERQALLAALKAGLVEKGDKVVITVGLPLHRSGTTNTIKVAVVE